MDIQPLLCDFRPLASLLCSWKMDNRPKVRKTAEKPSAKISMASVNLGMEVTALGSRPKLQQLLWTGSRSQTVSSQEMSAASSAKSPQNKAWATFQHHTKLLQQKQSESQVQPFHCPHHEIVPSLPEESLTSSSDTNCHRNL